MDLTLVRNAIQCFDRIFEYSASREETAETVVPDTMPDIERVLCADGVVIIRSKEAEAGSVTVTGGVAATVLYVPEDGGPVRCVSAALPFTCAVDAPDVTRDSVPMAMLRLCGVEARMLNPRKVLIRASVHVRLECYERTEVCLTAGLEGEGAADLETLTAAETISPVICAQEKTFVISDEYAPPPGAPAMSSLLRHSSVLRCDDVRSVGTKLIIKGRALTELTYLSESDAPYHAAYETEFSQIVETDLELKSPECRVLPLLTAEYVECGALSSGGRGVTLELHAVAQVICRDSIRAEFLTDCYSNRRAVSVTGSVMPASRAMGLASSRETVRENIELSGAVAEVRQTLCRAGETRMEGERAVCPVFVSVIYSDVSGGIYGVTRAFNAAWEPGVEDGLRCVCCRAECGEVYAAPSQRGVELRIPVDFEALLARDAAIAQIDRVELLEDAGPRRQGPSLTVVRAEGGSTLWQLGKRYHSTAAAITEVNALEDGAELSGRILIIPAVK